MQDFLLIPVNFMSQLILFIFRADFPGPQTAKSVIKYLIWKCFLSFLNCFIDGHSSWAVATEENSTNLIKPI